MPEKMRALLINPYDKTVTEVEVEPYPEWKKLIDADDINHVDLALNEDTGQKETVWVDGEGLISATADTRYFGFDHYPQPLAGKGIILGTDQAGETVSSSIPLAFVLSVIKWPDVVFDGLSYDEPKNEVHPVLGDVTIHRQHAHFHDRSEDEKAEQGDKREEGRTDHPSEEGGTNTR